MTLIHELLISDLLLVPIRYIPRRALYAAAIAIGRLVLFGCRVSCWSLVLQFDTRRSEREYGDGECNLPIHRAAAARTTCPKPVKLAAQLWLIPPQMHFEDAFQPGESLPSSMVNS